MILFFTAHPVLADEAPPTFEWSYVILALLIPAAILVYVIGNARAKRLASERNLEPKGRRLPRGTYKADPEFAAFVGRALQRNLITPIASAGAQPVMIRGVITSSDGNLGGPPGRECVFRNRSGAPREAAVAAEFLVVADATGRVTLENVDRAEVVAPEEKSGARVSSYALYLGDEVEVIGRFKPERIGDDPDPTRLVYGSMGGDGNLYIRVHRRAKSPTSADPPPTSSPPDPQTSRSDAPEQVSSPPASAAASQESTE
ncbi:MAG TPA: hypothetical protein VIK91_00160 [Nannocystis sp.]